MMFPFSISLILCLVSHGRATGVDLPSTIRKYAINHHFSGSIAVEVDGRRVYESSFGFANRAFQVPCRRDTKYQIASITKAFTSVLVQQLAEQGKIDLHRTIKTYLSNYTGEGAEKVTIEELLNHTSGIENSDSNIKSEDDALRHGIVQDQLPHSPDELVAMFCSGKLVHKPGKVFDYNNADYMILGKIIEVVTGKSFESVLSERILSPLHMANSGMLYQRNIVKNLACSYWKPHGKDTLINNMPVYPENWYSAGAMYSTVDDLLVFERALYSGKVIKQRSLDAMLKPGLGGYGYGVWIGFPKFGGKRYRNINRPGGIMGACGSFYHFNGLDTSKKVDIVILSNTNEADLDGFSWEIGKALLDH